MQTYDHGTFLIVLDCSDLERASEFWCAALGYDQPFPQSGPYLQLVAGQRGGVELLLQLTEEPKTNKNRMHLDLRTPDLKVEVDRLTGLGAAVLTARPHLEHDWLWHVLADPDGNEFCVLQPPTDFPWPTPRAKRARSGAGEARAQIQSANPSR
jgi:predicted enzyme related to lactoylglutathione lyase